MPNDAPGVFWCVACDSERDMDDDLLMLDIDPVTSRRHRINLYSRELSDTGEYFTAPMGVCDDHETSICPCGCERLVSTSNWQRSLRHGGVLPGMWSADGTQVFHAERCDRCREWYRGGEPHGRCQSILNYSWRPEHFTFHGGPWANDDASDPLFMGMELEVEIDRNLNPRTFANALLDALEEPVGPPHRVFIKSDGSIDHGFEIVTMPHTLAAYREGGLVEAITEHESELRETEERSNVGIHIHVNRSAFRTPRHLWRFLQLHNRNPTFVKAIAGRSGNTYASWDAAVDLFRNSEEVARMKDRPWGHNSHSTAINTGNDHTIELRYFKATVVPALIHKNLEWVHAAWEYCQTDEESIPLDSLSFLDWLAASEDDYPHFITWCREHELLLDQAEASQLAMEPAF